MFVYRIWIVVAALVCLGLSPIASAQRYQPSRPTVSPYMNLLRNNNSPIPNYYSFVRPHQNQTAFNEQQLDLQSRQNGEILRLQADALRNQNQTAGPVSGSASWFQNPGSRSTFMNTSRYYSRVGGR